MKPDLSHFDTAQLAALDAQLDELLRSQQENQLLLWYNNPPAPPDAPVGQWITPGRPRPYPWQAKFHAMGANTPERAVIAANRVGKTMIVGAEIAMHLTGWYPNWWIGRRFYKPIEAIVSGPTNLLTRNTNQRQLLGTIAEGREPTGHGWIPKNQLIAGGCTFRQCGIANVIDEVEVRHATGGASRLKFMSHEMGATKFQSVSADIGWLDEEPEDEGIWTELLTRLLDRDGLFFLSRTPLFGMTSLIKHFLDGGPGIGYVTAGWQDAPHLDEARREQMRMSFPEHERDTRTRGFVMMGSGGVYPVRQEEITCAPFPIPRHFRRIAAVDFGIDHPAAAVWCALDADTDVLYIYDSYRTRGQTPIFHAAQLNSRGKWIPVAWPHDGLVRDRSGGAPIAEQYRTAGANMLPESARLDEEKGGRQDREAATMLVLERMRTGRLRIFDTQTELLEEIRQLHRKDAKIVDTRDDMESAMRYAVMEIRSAVTVTETESWGTLPQQADWSGYNPHDDYRESRQHTGAA